MTLLSLAQVALLRILESLAKFKNLRGRGFFPQLQQEVENQAPDPQEPSSEPQGSSLLMLQALQELDLTACSKLTDASLAKV